MVAQDVSRHLLSTRGTSLTGALPGGRKGYTPERVTLNVLLLKLNTKLLFF